jgi:hypothetical protein
MAVSAYGRLPGITKNVPNSGIVVAGVVLASFTRESGALSVFMGSVSLTPEL